jgi:hypothetical protein
MGAQHAHPAYSPNAGVVTVSSAIAPLSRRVIPALRNNRSKSTAQMKMPLIEIRRSFHKSEMRSTVPKNNHSMKLRIGLPF